LFISGQAQVTTSLTDFHALKALIQRLVLGAVVLPGSALCGDIKDACSFLDMDAASENVAFPEWENLL
jgi:hypothetical protein